MKNDSQLKKERGLGWLAVLVGLLAFTLLVISVSTNDDEIKNVPIKKQKEKQDSVIKVGNTNLKIYTVSISETLKIPKNGSLCGSLKMSETRAINFAKKYNYPIRWRDYTTVVLIPSGAGFHLVNNEWQPIWAPLDF